MLSLGNRQQTEIFTWTLRVLYDLSDALRCFRFPDRFMRSWDSFLSAIRELEITQGDFGTWTVRCEFTFPRRVLQDESPLGGSMADQIFLTSSFSVNLHCVDLRDVTPGYVPAVSGESLKIFGFRLKGYSGLSGCDLTTCFKASQRYRHVRQFFLERDIAGLVGFADDASPRVIVLSSDEEQPKLDERMSWYEFKSVQQLLTIPDLHQASRKLEEAKSAYQQL